MAPSLYKWLLAGFFAVSHPFYVSVTEINHNAKDKTLEISCKIFTDDFEDALSRKYKTKVDLVQPKDKPAMDKLVNDYIKNHLAVKADNKARVMDYIGFEVENEAVYVYMQVNDIPTITRADVTNSVLYDLFNDQTEIIHFIENGNRKSVKIDYPATVASFQF